MASSLCQNDIQIPTHLFQCQQFIRIDADHRTFSPVYGYDALFSENRVRFIYCMHIDPDTFCHLSYRRKRISVLQSGCRDSQYDLVAKLHINRFFTVKVYLQQFYLHLFTLLSLFCVLFII